jgi:hypothetical protein
MTLSRKFLWIVDMDTEPVETSFSKHALAIGATSVCIRTSSKRMPGSIATFKNLGMEVYAWRWPQVAPAKVAAEADYVAKKLITAGLDGYIVDPESDVAGANNDWNQTKLAPLAKSFCDTIRRRPASRLCLGRLRDVRIRVPLGNPTFLGRSFLPRVTFCYRRRIGDGPTTTRKRRRMWSRTLTAAHRRRRSRMAWLRGRQRPEVHPWYRCSVRPMW